MSVENRKKQTYLKIIEIARGFASVTRRLTCHLYILFAANSTKCPIPRATVLPTSRPAGPGAAHAAPACKTLHFPGVTPQ